MSTDATNLAERLQRALGDAYALERELGGGGMSRIFVARDARLGRRVVIKVLNADLATGVSAARFEREITLAARLQHPHVVPLLSAGDVEGLPFYIMPFVEGESLRARLKRDGALAMPVALSLVREIADALAYAHAQGVVHRDLKPENVLLSDGHAMVADFGVAKALSSATQGERSPGATLTSVGFALGTPAYMAPEQALGDPSADHRSDLYALGVVAYELVAGVTPFGGRTPHQLVAAHLTEAPPSLAEKRPDVPDAFATLVAKLLEKDPLARPQSASEVLRALSTVEATDVRARRGLSLWSSRRASLAIGAGLLMLVGFGGYALWRSRRITPVQPRPSVAVLPFVNTGGNADDEHFSDGLTDELIGALGKVAGLKVVGLPPPSRSRGRDSACAPSPTRSASRPSSRVACAGRGIGSR